MASTNERLLEMVDRLEHQPLRNIVLLKHIEAFREHVSVEQASEGPDTATLVLLKRPQAPTIERPIRRRHSSRSYRAITLA